MIEELVQEYLSTERNSAHDVAALKGALKSGVDILHASTDDWNTVFAGFKSSNARVLSVYKGVIKKFLMWAHEHQHDTAAALQSLRLHKVTIEIDPDLFFGSYGELRENLEQTVSPNSGQYRTFILEMCLYSLGWFGVNYKECLDLLKEDVEIVSPTLCILHLPGRTKEIKRSDVVALLEEYKTASTFDFGYSRIGSYQPSKYLFRTMVNAKIDAPSMAVRQAKFNEMAKEGGVSKRFYFPNVYWSAMYARVFDTLSSVGYVIPRSPVAAEHSRFEKLFGEKYTRAIQFRSRYDEFYSWCKTFRAPYFG